MDTSDKAHVAFLSFLTGQLAAYCLIGGSVPYAMLGVEGCYSLQTLDKTMSDRISMLRLIL